MSTLPIKVSSGNLESYEALFLQLAEPQNVGPVEKVELTFGDTTQIFPSAFGLIAAYVARTRDRAHRPLVSRRFGANPQSAKIERAMDAMGFLPAMLGDRATKGPLAPGVVPLTAIDRDTEPAAVASRVLDAIVAAAQPTRDAKESLHVIITELVENVVRHAEAESTAFLCGQLSTQKKKLELCLADAGIGVRAAFEGGKNQDAIAAIRAGASPLRLAVEAGRTAKGAGNTGFGLYIALTAARLNKGVFRLTSGDETLIVSREGEKHRTHARWHGTVVNLLFNLDKVGSIAEVYRTLPLPLPESDRFLGPAPPPGMETTVALKADGTYLGSRVAAERVRGELQAAVQKGLVAVADLDGVAALAPAYADALFGELLDALGEDAFRASIGVKGANEASRLLIEAVLERRAKPRAASPERAAKATKAKASGEAPVAEEKASGDAPVAEAKVSAEESDTEAEASEDAPEAASVPAAASEAGASEPVADEAEDSADPDEESGTAGDEGGGPGTGGGPASS